jgi:ornithine--oxo-acid transaminase
MSHKTTQEIIELTERYGAHNYAPLPIVIDRAEGIWVYDPEGTKYLDFLSCYSAVSQGHCHPKIVKALVDQASRVTLTSRAFYNSELGPFCEELAQLCGMEMVLPMNSGAEAVETALKVSRKWGYKVKGIPAEKAEIIVCAGNFHGRTTTIVGFSTDELYKQYFGPYTPGFTIIPYGDAKALAAAITPNTAAFLVEPIQGEAGVVLPPEGYLAEARRICDENKVLLVADEVQTGLGRTGKMFACQWENVRPDVYILGKALSGGVYPVSAVVSDRAVLGLLVPGEHGSTFGGNPLGVAAARAALRVLKEERLAERSQELGEYFKAELKKIKGPHIVGVRGRGLFIGVVLDVAARPYCEQLMKEQLLCKETHEKVVRFAPPLVITRDEIDWAVERIARVLSH